MKSQEPFTFRHIFNVDIANIKSIVQGFEDEWNLDVSRQETFENHKLTKTFFLSDYPLEWKIGDPYAGSIRDPESDLWKSIEPIVLFLENLYNGRVGRVMLPKLMAHGNIQKHVDAGDYLDVVRRHHIPIVTHESVMFGVDGRSLNMKEGELWEINNMLPHSVENPSDIDRVHLMIDIIPQAFLG